MKKRRTTRKRNAEAQPAFNKWHNWVWRNGAWTCTQCGFVQGVKKRTPKLCTSRKANGILGDLFRGTKRAAKKTGRGYMSMLKATHRPKFAAADANSKSRGRRASDKRASMGFKKSAAAPAPRLEFTDAEVRQMIKDRDPRISARPHRNPVAMLTRGGIWTNAARKTNSGIGRQFTFHGAYEKKSDAIKKESATPGSFVKFVLTRSGGRFLVMKPNAMQENPRLRKKNVEFGEYEKGIFHPWTRRSVTQLRAAKRGTRRIPRNYSSKGLNGPKRNPQTGKPFCQMCGSENQVRSGTGLRGQKMLMCARCRKGVKEALADRAKNPRARRNGSLDDAAQLYKDFHGAEPKKLTEVLQTIISRDAYASLGTLVKIVQRKPAYDIEFSEDAHKSVMLASDVKGNQLFLIGGDQDCSSLLQQLGGSRKDLIDLGEIKSIEYFARKKFDNFQPITYVHELGEVSGTRPRLMYDRLNKQLHIVGGNYKVKPEGIVD